MNIGPDRVGEFDVVLFLGALYHPRHPFLGLERAASVTRACLVVETLLDLCTLDCPTGAFYPGNERNGDPTNSGGLNQPAVQGMLEVRGFRRVEFMLPPGANPRISGSMRGSFHVLRT